MADILYPGRRKRPFRMGLVFDAFTGGDFERAMSLARRLPVYKETTVDGRVRHHAGFDAAQAEIFRDLYALVGHLPNTDVLVDNKRVPYAREIWMPLYFI